MEQELVIALTPLVIAGLKQLARVLSQNLPDAVLPALAPVVGVIVGVALAQLGWGEVGATDGAVLGLAGTGAREAIVKAVRIARG